MTTRDDYIEKLKAQLDHWNNEVTKWEAQAKGARAELQVRYAKELDVLRAQRELARYNLKLLEEASATAWVELRKGADEAWDRMQAAVNAARAHFEKRG